MKVTDYKINSILKRLNQLEMTDIVPTLLKMGFDRAKAYKLVRYFEEHNLADLDYSHELKFKSTSESSKPVELKDLYIKGKITIDGKNYLKNHQTFVEKRLNDWRTYLVVSLPILLFTAWYNGLWSSNSETPQEDSITFTVFVHGQKGVDDLILKNQGKVILDLLSDRREATINEKGEATFKGIPPIFNGKSIKIYIEHPEPYRPVILDSLYTVNNGQAVSLKVKLYNTENIYGRVIDAVSNIGIDSVRVSIRDVYALTDKTGYYDLEIPLKYQKKFQNVRFEKNGYKPVQRNNTPIHTNQSLDILISKIDNE